MDNSDIKISVIIPVYNAEEYIPVLIKSLKAQTFKAVEYIFVDDRGKDGSMNIVSQWAMEDPRVRILVNEQNLGEGGSRNRGMEEARGTYINTIDPDDWLAPNFYELLYEKAVETSADIVKGTRVKISEESRKELLPRSELNKTITSSLSEGEPLYSRLNYEHQTIIFKRTLLDGETKYGKSGNAADNTFLLKLTSKTCSFAVEDKAYYYYLIRKTSATGEFSLKRSRNELISFEEQIDHFLQGNVFEKHAYRYLASMFNTFASRFVHAFEEGKVATEDKEKYIADIKAQLLRIPDYEKLYEYNQKIFATIELDIILCKELYKDIWACKTQVADWVTYILALDGEKQETTRKKLKSMLVSYIKARKKSGASLKVMINEIFTMRAELKDAKQKSLFNGIVKDAFKENYPRYRKTLFKLLTGSGK